MEVEGGGGELAMGAGPAQTHPQPRNHPTRPSE